MNFESRSQAGQDLWVHELLPKHNGFFIDIGCNEPVVLSNTYALEQWGWTGILLDNSQEHVTKCQNARMAGVLLGDAASFDWRGFLEKYYGVPYPNVDYLSLDVDEASLRALENFPIAEILPKLITIEHDAYRFGDTLRKGQRELLTGLGYRLERADVCNTPGMPFEDWYLLP